MDSNQRPKLVWSWLRFFLGIAQMAFAIAGVAALLQFGITKVSLGFVLAATALTVASKLLFKGK